MPSRDLTNASEVETKLDELVPRRSAGVGTCRHELDFFNYTYYRGDLTAAVESRHLKFRADPFSSSAELANAQDIEDWIDDRNARSQIPLLTSVGVVESKMKDLGFHAASSADITTAVAARRQRFVDGEGAVPAP